VPVGNVQLLIDVQTLESGSYSFEIESQGTVRPLTETILSAEVSGSIVRVSPKFIAGGVFAAGEELMRIDPTNYVGAVDQAVALVKQRQIEFDGAKTLRTQGYRAEAEFAAAEAALATAKANLIRARRDFERTRIRLPYEGMVRSRSANLGQFVNPGKELGVVFATDIAEVRLPLTDQDLAFVDLPDASEITESGVSADGPAVTLTAVQRGRPVSWTAKIVRSEGVVDERARVTYAVARIADPYRLHRPSAGEVPLPMGTFVSARIAGVTVDRAVRLPRSSLRSRNEVVFVDKENRLRIRPVEVIRTDSEYAYVTGDTLVGERISLTAIESPINGAKVRTTDDPPEQAGNEQELASAGNGGD
jgi:RND family efflux transporter MFP subunit